jgi:hypothetical protein
MNMNALLVAGGAGLAAQLIMVISGHYVPFIKDNVFALGGMAISLAAGLAYAMIASEGWGPSLAGAFLAGGVCALIGIAVSFGLKDVVASILLFGTLGSAVAGLVGGVVGKIIA